MTLLASHTLITEPGIYPDIDEQTYHNDPVAAGSLNASGAKAILKTPAHYIHQRGNRIHKDVFDLGSAVHSEVLGKGWPVRVLDFDNWRTKAAGEARDEARALGEIPILAAEYATVRATAAAVLAHPTARALFECVGVAEASLFAPDPATGVWMRGRIDWLQDVGAKPAKIVDLKTARSADPREFENSAASYAYDIQDAWYKHLLSLIRGDFDPEFVFVVVEKEAPYLVSVVELDAEFIAIGRQRMRRAIDTFKRCRDADDWPGYPDDIQLVGAPRWLAYAEEMVF